VNITGQPAWNHFPLFVSEADHNTSPVFFAHLSGWLLFSPFAFSRQFYQVRLRMNPQRASLLSSTFIVRVAYKYHYGSYATFCGRKVLPLCANRNEFDSLWDLWSDDHLFL